MANKDVQMDLESAVGEVLNILTGLDLQYDPNVDRFQSITRALNRALRSVALERDWSYFASTEEVGVAVLGQRDVELSPMLRPRILNDDCVRLVDDNGTPRDWAYFLPRDAIHKYEDRAGLWACVTRTTLTFSRQLYGAEAGLHIMVPVMREPRPFRLPTDGETVPPRILKQLIDFDFPDLVIAKAAQYVAASDPLMQPRVQTLEAWYKDIMYQLVARDESATDSPYSNEFIVPIQNSVNGSSYSQMVHGHPHSDERHS